MSTALWPERKKIEALLKSHTCCGLSRSPHERSDMRGGERSPDIALLIRATGEGMKDAIPCRADSKFQQSKNAQRYQITRNRSVSPVFSPAAVIMACTWPR